MTAPAVSFEAISKSFFGVQVLHDVSLTVPSGRIVGLVGENGAGKSTLMNILGGVHQPDGGRMRLHGEPYAPAGPRDAAAAGIAFIHQELNLFTNLSIAENLQIARFPRRGRLPLIDRRGLRAFARQQLERVQLDVSPDTLVERLSVGERQLVEIGKALGADAQVIILDEPTTSLTARESERLFEVMARLREEGRSMIYISHMLSDVERLCDEVVVLRDGKVIGQGAIGDVPVGRMIQLMVGRSIDQLYPQRTAQPGDEPVLEVHGLNQTGIVKDIELTVRQQEVVGLFGLMGSGRSELARILFGLDPYESGSIVVNGRERRRRSPRRSVKEGVAFLTENRRDEGLLMDIAIRDNVALASLQRFRRRGTPLIDDVRLGEHVRQLAGALRVRAASLDEQDVKSLSGGNQQKVVLAKWLATEPQLFILDEPTRGVDIGAKEEIYGIVDELAGRGAGVLMISSDLEELIGTCDRIVVMRLGETVADVPRDRFDREDLLAAAFGEQVVA
jgi:ribose transport system ATP-binding protein